jgi:hypothetical protein
MKIFIIGFILMLISLDSFASSTGTSFYRKRNIEGRECLYFYDHKNNLVSVSCSCG